MPIKLEVSISDKGSLIDTETGVVYWVSFSHELLETDDHTIIADASAAFELTRQFVREQIEQHGMLPSPKIIAREYLHLYGYEETAAPPARTGGGVTKTVVPRINQVDIDKVLAEQRGKMKEPDFPAVCFSLALLASKKNPNARGIKLKDYDGGDIFGTVLWDNSDGKTSQPFKNPMHEKHGWPAELVEWFKTASVGSEVFFPKGCWLHMKGGQYTDLKAVLKCSAWSFEPIAWGNEAPPLE